jgi:hypothetical protein
MGFAFGGLQARISNAVGLEYTLDCESKQQTISDACARSRHVGLEERKQSATLSPIALGRKPGPGLGEACTPVANARAACRPCSWLGRHRAGRHPPRPTASAGSRSPRKAAIGGGSLLIEKTLPRFKLGYLVLQGFKGVWIAKEALQ